MASYGSPVILSLAVMYRPERRVHAQAVARRAGAQLICDPRADLPPTPDGTWRTASRAWRLGLLAGSTHHVVLQDDVDLCPRFTELARRAVQSRPHDAITFYANRAECADAAKEGSNWAILPANGWRMGQALALPSEHLAPMIRHGATASGCDAERFASYLQACKLPFWATVPSLVEHGAPSSSLIGYNNRSRTSRVSWRSVDLNQVTFE